ncbi:MAG: hypothetical protein IT260_16355, partial [Saprospiraceae bacterium]|nr:hypothetical protein [Saprospiraceae bacterium]
AAQPHEATPHAAEGHVEPHGATTGGTEAGHGDGAHGEGANDHFAEPGEFKIGYTIPGFQELGVMIGFLSLFLFFFFNQLQRAPLLPLKDPYLEESLHHSTGVYLDEEGDDHHGH